jgi:2-polyprenyl-6-methoxyphenol hydroxylase-like FAD-dependent oxidoreductase
MKQGHLDTPLVAGAGPVGLAAALFLKKHDIRTRLIERAQKPSETSRALAVNPRTMEILEPSGVTGRMLKLGLPILGAKFRHNDNVLFELTFEHLHHKYPFMLALSQATTERLLAEEFEKAGGVIERGLEIAACRNEGDHAVAYIMSSDQSIEQYVAPWILGADGSRSTVRSSLNIPFEGRDFQNPWYLLDVPLTIALEENSAHIFILDGGGFIFCIRVVDDRTQQSGPTHLWRLVGNTPDLLSGLPLACIAGMPIWKSSFHIGHRVAEHLQEGNIYLAGDAAHIHSPVGARGMNLGIEDAWILSELAACGEMHNYESLRFPVDRRVVKRIELLSLIAKGESAAARLVRRFILPQTQRIPVFARKMIELATGLDQPLPIVCQHV